MEIKRIREIRGLSRERLSEISGLHINSIGAIERGERDVSCISQTYIFASLGCKAIHVMPEYDQIILHEGAGDFVRRDVFSLRDAQIIAFIGDMLRLRRKALGLDLSLVAEKAGIHLNTLWNIEKGLVISTGANLHRLYLALNLEWISASKEGIRF
ncbi:MAG: transcriptional regulator [Spirochaetales bacterium]|nr:transcriptional regulator [Spirochaetales bacterium]